nr:caspase family protein [Micromonospora inyonensis]
MADRHALLIGVPTYDADLFPSMRDVVNADVARMADALGRSGYHIEFCGAGSSATAEPTGGRIKAAILRACAAVPPDGVLLVYFSGHGVTLGGESFLVPCDAYETMSGDLPARDSLVPVIPNGLRQCQARLVVFLIDACRQDPAADAVTPIGGGNLSWLEHGDLALINSCRPGEQSGYSDTGSFFTTALAEVVDRRNPARTLRDVFTAVEIQMARKTARTDGLRQRPHLALATGRSGPGSPDDVVICDGDQVSEAWRRAVENTALWQHGTSPEHHETVRAALLKLVAQGARQWQDVQDLLPEKASARDPWSAHNYPIRVLTEMEGCLTEHATLGPLELGMLIAAPFLREIALSAGLREAAGIGPTLFERTYQDGPRHDLEITHAIHEHVCRRAEGLARRGKNDARDALALWLVHGWLNGRTATWDAPALHQSARRLATVLTCLPGATTVTENEVTSVLRVLARAVGAGAEDALLSERLRWDDFAPRTRALGALLMVAGVMAADLRRMPTVVVDHVGTGSQLQIATLHEAAMRLRWHRCAGRPMTNDLAETGAKGLG